MVNLFLYYFDNKWLLDIKKRDLQNYIFLEIGFCFIDDLCSINDHLELDKNYKDICSSESKLKKKNMSASETLFLHLSVVTQNEKLKTKLFDKRYEFAFSIACIPHLEKEFLHLISVVSESNIYIT